MHKDRFQELSIAYELQHIETGGRRHLRSHPALQQIIALHRGAVIRGHNSCFNLRPEFGGCFAFCLVREGLGVTCFHYIASVGGWWG